MVIKVDEETFTQEVLGSPTPVLVNFWAPWCGICRAVQPLLLRFQADWGDQVKLVSINADENFKLANTYRLTTLPTIILFDAGSVYYRLDEFKNREDLRVASDTIQVALKNLTVRYGCSA